MLADSGHDYGVDLLGPTRPDYRRQAPEGAGFEAERFVIDWENQEAVCPEGHTSIS